MAKLTKLEKQLLAVITEQLKSAAYTLANAEDVKPLVDAGLLISDPAGENGYGLVAVALPGTESATVETQAVVSGYAIEVGIPVPAAKKRQGGKKGEVYPFSKLEVGASFFVAASESKPNPAKSLRGTISTAVRRFAIVSDTATRTNRKGETVPALVATKRFVVEGVTAGQTYSNGFVEKADGARVFRVQ